MNDGDEQEGSGSGPEAGSERLSAAKAADAAVRRVLVESYREFLAFLQRRMGNKDQAEEVLQAFVMRAIERAEDLRDVRTVRGWLSRILATTIIDFQRRGLRRRRREVPMDTDFGEAFTVEPDAEIDKAVCDCLYKLLPTLKAEHAEVIWRVDLLGEPRDRVAATLGTTVNNVSVRLHRGRHALRKRLEEMCLICPEHGFLDCHCDEARRRAEMRERARNTVPNEQGAG